MALRNTAHANAICETRQMDTQTDPAPIDTVDQRDAARVARLNAKAAKLRAKREAGNT